MGDDVFEVLEAFVEGFEEEGVGLGLMEGIGPEGEDEGQALFGSPPGGEIDYVEAMAFGGISKAKRIVPDEEPGSRPFEEPGDLPGVCGLKKDPTPTLL